MKVLLLQDVKGHGKKGQVVDASDGYAANFLFPKKLACPADAKIMNELKSKEEAKKHKDAQDKLKAQQYAQKFTETIVKIYASSGADGRLYGAVTSKEIADALKEQTGIEVDKRKIVLPDVIKAFGSFTIDVKLYPDVVGKLNVLVAQKN